jgi:hypothetical protein
MAMVENDNSDTAGQENIDDSQKCCPSDLGEGTCCCSAGRKYGKMKLVVFAIIVIAAGIVLAHSLTKEPSEPGACCPPGAGQTECE